MTFQNIGYLPKGGATIDTDTGKFDTNYAEYSVSLNIATNIKVYLNTPKAEAWFHFNLEQDDSLNNNYDGELLRIVDDGGVVLMRWQFLNGVGTVYYNIGGSDVSIGTFTYAATKVQNHIDFHVKIDAAVGVFRVYSGGVMIQEFTGDTVGSLTGRLIEYIKFGSSYSLGVFSADDQPCISEFCIAYDGDSTLNKRIFNKAPTGNGAETDWAGDYTSVDGDTPEAGVESTTAAETETYTFPALPGSGAVQAMAVQTIGAEGGAVTYDHVARVSGTNYESPPVPVVDGVSRWHESIWTTNPDTAGGLTVADINSMEFGFDSDDA